jgi:hypothetical protein
MAIADHERGGRQRADATAYQVSLGVAVHIISSGEFAADLVPKQNALAP